MNLLYNSSKNYATSGETKFMLLESFTKHPSRSTNSGWKVDRGTTQLHARILRGKGVQTKKPNMFTVSSTSATFVPPVYSLILNGNMSLL